MNKISTKFPALWETTSHVSLVSSFVASLLLGRVALLDKADASGMNIYDIRGSRWVPELLEWVGKDSMKKLGEVVPSHSILGDISRYFQHKYLFTDCKIVAFSGDNPCSVAGLRMRDGDVAISLGTSDTLFGLTPNPRPSGEGHVFCDPTHPEGYMVLLCYKNGSLTREFVK
jgi:xylulokinase